MNIISKKEQMLKNIISSNNAYKGDYLDKVRKGLVKQGWNKNDIDIIMFEFQDYANHLLHLLACTPKVYVKLDKYLEDMSAEEYNKVFDDID